MSFSPACWVIPTVSLGVVVPSLVHLMGPPLTSITATLALLGGESEVASVSGTFDWKVDTSKPSSELNLMSYLWVSGR